MAPITTSPTLLSYAADIAHVVASGILDFMRHTVADPIAVWTALLASATFVSTWYANRLPQKIERKRDLRERELRRLNLDVIATILLTLKARLATKRSEIQRHSGSSPDSNLSGGVDQMLFTLFDPNVYAAIGDADVARSMYLAATTAGAMLGSAKWDFKPFARTTGWKAKSISEFSGAEAWLLNAYKEIEALKTV